MLIVNNRVIKSGTGGGALSKSMINMRLAPGDVSATLTGYSHNGVSPLGLATPMPMVISHHIVSLLSSQQTQTVWLGAGEKDLKVQVHTFSSSHS